MLKAGNETTTVVPWPRKAQDVPSVLLGSGSRAPQRLMSRRQHEAALKGTLALVEGLQAGRAAIQRLKREAKQAAARAKAERRQETRTKLAAFSIYYLLAAVMLGMLYAGAGGLG